MNLAMGFISAIFCKCYVRKSILNNKQKLRNRYPPFNSMNTISHHDSSFLSRAIMFGDKNVIDGDVWDISCLQLTNAK